MRQASRMNFVTALLGLMALSAAVCMGLAALSGYTTTLDDRGLAVRNPQSEAQATRTAQLAMDEAAQRAIQRQMLQAEAEAAQATTPILAVRNALLAVGVGAGGLVLAVGAAFAAVAWLNKRATSIYPNSAGQYPLITRRGFGWVVVHDPNRGLGPAAVYRTPTLLDTLASAVWVKDRKLAQAPGPSADFPPTASESTMLQVASQAQAIGLMAAVTRPAGFLRGPAIEAKQARQLASEIVSGSGAMSGRMPSVRVIDDPEQAAQFRELLELEGSA